MANYTQYNGTNGQTTMAQRLLNNGSDYICVRVGQYDYLFIQGRISHDGNRITYDGQTWLYNSQSNNINDLTYRESDTGTITLYYNSYVYSSLPEFQSLTVNDVFSRFLFFLVFAFILLYLGFKLIKRRFVL